MGDDSVGKTVGRALGGGQGAAQGNADQASEGQNQLAAAQVGWGNEDRNWYNQNVRPGLTAEIDRTQDPGFVEGQRALGASRSAADFTQSEAGLDAAHNRSFARLGLNPADQPQATSSDQVRRIAARTGAVNTGANQMELTARGQRAAALQTGAGQQTNAYGALSSASQGYGAVANREQQVSDNQTNRSPVSRLLGATGFGAAKGGPMEVPGEDQQDTIPATVDGVQPARLNHGEFVVDAPTKNWMGEKFFHKLKEKAAMERHAARQSTPGNTAPPTHQIIRPQRYAPGGPVPQAPQADPRAAAISGFARNWYANRGVLPSAPPAPTARYDGGGPVYIKQAQGGPAKGFARITKVHPARAYAYGGEVGPTGHAGQNDQSEDLYDKLNKAGGTIRNVQTIASLMARGGPIAKPLPMPTGAAQTDAMMAGMPQGKQMAGMVQPGLPGQAQLQQQMKKGQVRRVARMAEGGPIEEARESPQKEAREQAAMRRNGKGTVRRVARFAAGGPVNRAKVGKTMHEFKHGALHSTSKTGPLVKDPKQAIAIALNQARRMAAGGPITSVPSAEPWPWGDNGQPYTEVEKKKSFGNKQGMAYGGPVRRYAAGDVVGRPGIDPVPDPAAAPPTDPVQALLDTNPGMTNLEAVRRVSTQTGWSPSMKGVDPRAAGASGAPYFDPAQNTPGVKGKAVTVGRATGVIPADQPVAAAPNPGVSTSNEDFNLGAGPGTGAVQPNLTAAADQAPGAVTGQPAKAIPASASVSVPANPADAAAQSAAASAAGVAAKTAGEPQKPEPFKIPLWAYFMGPTLFGMYVAGKHLEFNKEHQDAVEAGMAEDLKTKHLNFLNTQSIVRNGAFAHFLMLVENGDTANAHIAWNDPALEEDRKKSGAVTYSYDGKNLTMLTADGTPAMIGEGNARTPWTMTKEMGAAFVDSVSNAASAIGAGVKARLMTQKMPQFVDAMLAMEQARAGYYRSRGAYMQQRGVMENRDYIPWSTMKGPERDRETTAMNTAIQKQLLQTDVMKRPTPESLQWINAANGLAAYLRQDPKLKFDMGASTQEAIAFARWAQQAKVPPANLRQVYDAMKERERQRGQAVPGAPQAPAQQADQMVRGLLGKKTAQQGQRVQGG